MPHMSLSRASDEKHESGGASSHELITGTPSSSQPPPYTTFSQARRHAIAYQSSFSAMFSGLSSFIYYPAIRPLADTLEVSITAINLTVFAYLIVGGVFPSIMGDMSEQAGRRPASLLAFTFYFSANLGIALQNNYAVLVVLRCLQSAGSAGTITIAYGVIADITTPAERGSYVGILMGFTNVAPSLGPVLGGLIAQELSWRWIFWLLTILSGAHLFGLLLLFPETSRKLVGNGSLIPRSQLNRTVCAILQDRKSTTEPSTTSPKLTHIPNPLISLKMLFHKPTFIIVAVGSIQYAIFGALGTSLATVMAETYSLNFLTAGLIYLPSGIGGLLAALLTGKLIDHDFRVAAQSLHLRQGDVIDINTRSPNDLLAFPIEKARLRSIFLFVPTASIATVGYGWSIHAHSHIAIPLVLQFLLGSTQVATFVVCGTLLTDYNPNRSATAQAGYNLVRCTLAGGCIAALEPLVQGVGAGWSFTVFTALGLLCVPLLFVLRVKGWEWRKQRTDNDGIEMAS